jgi:hypothetical protein
VPPVGRALLWDRASWAHAKNGGAHLCLRAFDAAGEAFSDADEDERPAWAYSLDWGADGQPRCGVTGDARQSWTQPSVSSGSFGVADANGTTRPRGYSRRRTRLQKSTFQLGEERPRERFEIFLGEPDGIPDVEFQD